VTSKLSIPSVDRLRRLQGDGLIVVRSLDNLIIVNYTDRCTYKQQWDDTTMICRGLVLQMDKPWPNSTRIKEVVALPLVKFFNIGEGGRYPSSPLLEVTEKLDGSFGELFRWNDSYRIATRGSFESEQAQWATEYLRRCDLSGLKKQYTLIFEIIYPDGRIVVDYGSREDLVLLAVRDRFNGNDHPFSFVREMATEFGFSL
jgi:RNA ligase